MAPTLKLIMISDLVLFSACGSNCKKCSVAAKCDTGQCDHGYGLNSNNGQNTCGSKYIDIS